MVTVTTALGLPPASLSARLQRNGRQAAPTGSKSSKSRKYKSRGGGHAQPRTANTRPKPPPRTDLSAPQQGACNSRDSQRGHGKV